MFRLLLGIVIQHHLIPQLPFAFRRVLDTGKDPAQRRFSSSLHPDQRDAIAPFNDEIEVTEDLECTVLFPHSLELYYHSATAWSWRKMKMDSFGNTLWRFKKFHFFELFDTA